MAYMKCAAFKLINIKNQYLDHLAITARAIKQFKTSLFFSIEFDHAWFLAIKHHDL
jgi:hypothetical protein